MCVTTSQVPCLCGHLATAASVRKLALYCVLKNLCKSIKIKETNMEVKNEGLPDLEGYLEERGRHLVTYTEGARMYHIPYHSFVCLAK